MEEEVEKKLAVKQKVGVKRIKTKPNLNISKGNLGSVSKKFSFLNASVQKQSLRANNRALAQNLSKARQDLRNLSAEHQELKVLYQNSIQELNKIKRLVGAKDEEIEEEVQRRMQTHVKEMRGVLEELTQNMLQSSHYINTLNDKFMNLSRRSTGSSRTDSLGNVSVLSDGLGNRLPLNQRHTAALRNKTQNSLMMKYLSSADEFSPPPFSDSQPFDVEKANMSVIAEQSFMQEESVPIGNILSKQMSTVSENEPETLSSKLPQRVFKGITSEDNTESKTSDKDTKKPCAKETVTGEINEKQNSKKKPTKKELEGKCNEARQDEGSTITSDMELGILDINDEIAELVSGSPIAKQPSSNKTKMEKAKGHSDNEKGGRQAVVSDKRLDKSETDKKTVPGVEIKPSKLVKVKSTGKLNKATSKKSSSTSINTQRCPRVEIPDVPLDDGSFNPFKPTRTLIRSPVKVGAPSIEISPASPEQKVDSVKFLASLKEPEERSCKIMNLAVDDDSVPEPSNFMDEHTVYFNSEMDLTTVCGFGKLLQSSKILSENIPTQQSLNTEINKQDNQMNSEEELKVVRQKDKSTGKTEINADKKEKNTNRDVETSQQGAGEAAAVEMRNKKPGIFTFSVSRKEADGTRKPVPEKPSRSRSKKAKNVTPEKEERNLGADRDMFNFGDRTPTVPLEKLLQSKNVYDLSMNESSIAPTSSLSDFRNGVKESKSVQQQKNEHIYSVPLKGSPDEKQELKSKGRSRSKSSTRSKSKSRQRNDSDDDWVPSKGRSRSRSSVRQKRALDSNDLEDVASGNHKTNTEKQLEEQKATSTEIDVKDEHIYSVPLKGSPESKTKDVLKYRSRSKSRTRSKSQSRKAEDSDEEIMPVRKSRSRSKKVSPKEFNKESIDVTDDGPDTGIRNSDKGDQREDVYHVPLKGSPDRKIGKETMRTRSRSRGRSNTRAQQSEEIPNTFSKSHCHDDEAIYSIGDKASSNHKSTVSDKELEHRGKDFGEQNNEHIYTVPLKDSPDKKVHSRSRSRSKSGRTRSKSGIRSESVAGVEDDSGEEILVESSRSKARQEDESTQIETQKENAVNEQADRNTDRKSGNAEEDEVSGKSTSLKMKRSARSKSLKKIDDNQHPSDNNISLPISFEDSKCSGVDKEQSNKGNEQKSKKDLKMDTTDETANKNETGSHNENSHQETHLTYNVPLKDSSDSTTIKKRTRSKSKGYQIAKNDDKIKSDVNPEIDNDSEIEKNEKEKCSKRKSKAKHSDVECVTDIAAKTFDYNESDFNFVNTGRSRKPKLNETFELDDNELCDLNDSKAEELTLACRDDISDVKSVADKKINSKTPKITTSKTSKSVKKTEKKKTSTSKKGEKEGAQIDMGERIKKSRQSQDLDLADTNTNARLSTKTPATTKSSSSAKSSKSTVSKSSRKRAVESKGQDQTPRTKKEKQDSSEQKENDPSGLSTLELLKKRLTMGTSRHSNIDPVDPDGCADGRKRSAIGLEVEEDLDCDDQSDGAKRSRRTKNQVSYVPKPLNAKLRRGDSLFDGSGSKAKAVEIRLQIAKKTGVLKDVKN